MSLTEAAPRPGRYFTGKPCPKGHAAERFSGNRECVECARMRWTRDPNKKARAKASGIRHQAKRTVEQRERYWADPEAARAYFNRRRQERIEKFLAYEALQRDRHREAKAACAARGRAARIGATPSWADRDKIAAFYRLARKMTVETGVPHEVDHIIPLQGKNVCGLHVETNLQVITKSENSRKQNKFIDAALK